MLECEPCRSSPYPLRRKLRSLLSIATTNSLINYGSANRTVGEMIFQDTQNIGLPLVVLNMIQIIRQVWADMVEQEQNLTPYVSKQ